MLVVSHYVSQSQSPTHLPCQRLLSFILSVQVRGWMDTHTVIMTFPFIVFLFFFFPSLFPTPPFIVS